MFSKACEYGIRACIYIANQSLQGHRVRLRDVAEQINTPEAFTAKIMQDLARNGIVTSVKGPKGGFEIDEGKIYTIQLKHIVEAIDGNSIFTGCGLGLDRCNSKNPCPIHNQFTHIRKALKEMLETTYLGDLALDVAKGNTFLKSI